MALRVDAGQALGALLLLLLVTLTVAGLAVGFLSAAASAGRADARPREPRARRRARGRARRRDPDARERAGRHRRPGLEGVEAGDRPRRLRPEQHPERLTATSSGRARYWREAMEGARARPCSAPARAPTGRCGCATASTRARSATRTATSCRRSPTSAGSGSACRCSRLIAWLAAAVRVLGLRRRDRGLPLGRRARRRGDAGVRSRSSSACTRRSTGRGSSRATRCRRCCAPAGSSRARRCASGWPANRRAAPTSRPPTAARVGAAALVLVIAGIAALGALQPVRAVERPGRRLRAGRPRRAAAGRVDRRDRPRAQPAVGRAAVRARRDRAGARAPATQARARARAGDRPRAREPGDLAPARRGCG